MVIVTMTTFVYMKWSILLPRLLAHAVTQSEKDLEPDNFVEAYSHSDPLPR